MIEFKPVSKENIKEIKKYLLADTSGFCDFTPFVLTMWQGLYKTEYAVCDSVLYLRYTIDGEIFYSAVTNDIFGVLPTLKTFPDFKRLTLVEKKKLDALSEKYTEFDVFYDEAWGDYIYSHESIALLSGKKYAGQRNHINKFQSVFPDWKYEKITSDNVKYVADFFEKIATVTNNEEHDYEAGMTKEYLNSFSSFSMPGGFVSANGNIVSFAVGEIISDTLFVHIEKANKSIPGAYPIIVREFARANPASFINREEDMGVEGLRISKLSYHPINILHKYTLTFR